MKKLFSTKYSAGVFNLALLFLRISVGALMLNHGYDKLIKFSEMKGEFMNFMGLGATTSLALVVFSEFFCSLLLILGLFTRLVTIPLIITMGVVIYKVGKMDIFASAELATLFFVSYVVILLLGPGKISVDGLISK